MPKKPSSPSLEERVASVAAELDLERLMGALSAAVTKTAPVRTRTKTWDEIRDKAPAADKATPRTEAKPRAKVVRRRTGGMRAYTVGTPFNRRSGTWTYYMVTTMQLWTNVRSAEQAHADSGQYVKNKLDWNWAAAQGYIIWEN